MGNNKPSSLRRALAVGTGTFFTAIFFAFFSEVVLPKLQFIILSFLFLLLIILIGIIFDIIGLATAVADDTAFHAKAAKKVRGSTQALMLLRNADKVANFCNDVVGDICGTVSGALGASIIFQLVTSKPGLNESILSMVMTGLVAALTVGGKAAGKRMAIEDAVSIVFRVGKVLAWFEEITGLYIFDRKNRRNKRR